MTDATSIATVYRWFAQMEARGSAPLYERIAYGVADDPELLRLLGTLPRDKQQPNLFLAAVRHVAGTPATFTQFRDSVLDNRDAVVATMLSRRTQTNEPARCAALYPLLASLPQPVALLEVGASAGLCLLPDRYGYDYDGVPAGRADSPLVLRCAVDGDHPDIPGEVTVAWRTGIDLNPLDVTDLDDVRWLETLIWPGHEERLSRLRAAIALARVDPPQVVPGDLNDRLHAVASQAPADATLVVYHTAVLNYVPRDARARFVEHVTELPGHWISQEGVGVLPRVDAKLRREPPRATARFILALDERPVAFTAPHGGAVSWLDA